MFFTWDTRKGDKTWNAKGFRLYRKARRAGGRDLWAVGTRALLRITEEKQKINGEKKKRNTHIYLGYMKKIVNINSSSTNSSADNSNNTTATSPAPTPAAPTTATTNDKKQHQQQQHKKRQHRHQQQLTNDKKNINNNSTTPTTTASVYVTHLFN